MATTRADVNQAVADRITEELHDLAREYRQWSPKAKSMQPVMGRWYEFRYCADPMLILDMLGPRDNEGNGMMDYILKYHQPDEVAVGLRNFFPPDDRTSGRVTLRKCRAAVNQRLSEIREREGRFRYTHDVMCLTCKHSTFSDYHSFACGEDLSEDDLIILAMGSDDPDQFIG